MPSIKIDNFAAGIVETGIDANAARRLHNVFLDDEGKPYKRNGKLVVATDSGQLEISILTDFDIKRWEGSGNDIDKKLVYVKNGRLFHRGVSTDIYGGLSFGSPAEIKASVHSDPAQAISLSLGKYNYPIVDKAHLIFPVHTDTDQFPMKVFWSSHSIVDQFVTVTAGLPKPVSCSFAPASPGSNHKYVYYVVLKRSYQIAGVFYTDRSPAFVQSVTTNVPISGAGAVTVSLNVALQKYLKYYYASGNAGAGLALEVYRTKDSQTVPYLATSVGFNAFNLLGATVAINDLTTDAQLGINNSIPLYSVGGFSETGTPPPSQFACATDKTAWYGNSKKNVLDPSSAYGPNVVSQSIPGDLDGVPYSFFYEFDSEITNMVSNDIYPLVFEENRLNRIEGQFGVDGSGGGVKRVISDRVGCIKNGAAQNIGGNLVVFTGKDQLYVTDGFNVKPYSGHIKKLYRSLVYQEAVENKKILSGFSDREKKLFFFSSRISSANESPNILVANLNHSEKAGSFTTMSFNGLSGSYISGSTYSYNVPRISAMLEIGGSLLLGSSVGTLSVLARHVPSDDSYWDNSGTIQVVKSKIISEIETTHLSFGTNKKDKWMTKATIVTRPSFVSNFGRSETFTATISNNTASASASSLTRGMLVTLGSRLFLVAKTSSGMYAGRIKSITASGVVEFYMTGSTYPIPNGTWECFILEGDGSVFLDLACKTDLRELSETMKPILIESGFVQNTQTPLLIDPEKNQIASRRFPKRRLRSIYKSIAMKTAFQVIANKAKYGSMSSVTSVVGANPYHTIVMPSLSTLGLLKIGDFIRFETDGYNRLHEIFYVAGNAITCKGYFAPIAVSAGWEIWSYDDRAFPLLESVEFDFVEYGTSIEPYTSASEERQA